jgi:SAM-dependent methyltransferase
LIRLGLADTKAGATPLQVTTFDLSDRVNQHLEAARRRARSGDTYVLHLPRDRESAWTQPLVAYWKRSGDRIGEPVPAIAPPSELGSVDVRAVRVPAATVLTITPHDLNIVLQRLEPLADGDRFDLIIATNLLVYYDVFERSLALVNVGKMLRPGGLFLANNSAPVILPPSMDLVGESQTAYSSRLNDRDRIAWYRRR